MLIPTGIRIEITSDGRATHRGIGPERIVSQVERWLRFNQDHPDRPVAEEWLRLWEEQESADAARMAAIERRAEAAEEVKRTTQLPALRKSQVFINEATKEICRRRGIPEADD